MIPTENVFKNYSVFITEGSKCYRLLEDGTKVKVLKSNMIDTLKFYKPYKLLHKSQFDFVKPFLLDKHNPVSLTEEQLSFYHRIQFITEQEYNDYLNYLKQQAS